MTKKALLVGVAVGQNSLSSAAINLHLLDNLARARGFETHILGAPGGHRAARENILQAIDDWLLQACAAGDTRLFAVTAHGYHAAGDDHIQTENGSILSCATLEKKWKSVPPGLNIVCLFDVCRERPDLFRPLSTAEKSFAAPPAAPPAPGAVQIIDDTPSEADHPWVDAFGCQPNKRCNYDSQGGVFTRAFVDVVARNPELPLCEIARQVAQPMSPAQQPQFIGPAGRLNLTPAF